VLRDPVWAQAISRNDFHRAGNRGVVLSHLIANRFNQALHLLNEIKQALPSCGQFDPALRSLE